MCELLVDAIDRCLLDCRMQLIPATGTCPGPDAWYRYLQWRLCYCGLGVSVRRRDQQRRADTVRSRAGNTAQNVTGEYFDRRTFFQDANRTIKRFHYPQVRAYFTW